MGNVDTFRDHHRRQCVCVYAAARNRVAIRLIPAQATRLHGLTFLTSFFLHAGVIHLIGNMYFLLVFGDDVENFLKPGRYLALIVLAAFIGDIAAFCGRAEIGDPVYRGQRWHRWHHCVLRTGIPPCEAWVPPALPFLVSLDSVASMVRFRSLVCFFN